MMEVSVQIEWEFGSWRQLYLLTWTAKKLVFWKNLYKIDKNSKIYTVLNL